MTGVANLCSRRAVSRAGTTGHTSPPAALRWQLGRPKHGGVWQQHGAAQHLWTRPAGVPVHGTTRTTHTPALHTSAAKLSTAPTEPDSSTNSEIRKPLLAWYTKHRGRARIYAVLGITGFGVYFFTKIGFNIVNFFSRLEFIHVGKFAFFAGVGATLASGLVLGYLRRYFVLRPEPAYSMALKRARDSAEVIDRLGAPLEIGEFRAYSFSEGALHEEKAAEDVPHRAQHWLSLLRFFWAPRALQIMFQLNGSRHSGVMAAELQKDGFGYKFNVLALNVLETGERVVLEGNPERVVYQGSTKLR